ncbi:MAG TPA: hypothetical protein VGO59_09250 [Verrucomicrobiae bacterium]|jgi:hypothetical protein
MEVKIVCVCGQKYGFDVEPVGGRMPVKVACPGCGADGTPLANSFLAQQFPGQAPAVPVATLAGPAAAPAPRPVVRIIQPQAAIAPPIKAEPEAIAPMIGSGAPVGIKAPARKEKQQSGQYSLGLGILGAFLGAGLGAGFMVGFAMFANFRFPFMGTCIGALTGLGARLLARGTDSTLGGIAAAIALVATGGSLFLMYGGLAIGYLITMAVSVYFAWKVAG